MKHRDTWQQEYNQKVHQKKLQNVKSTMAKETRFNAKQDKTISSKDETDRRSVYSSGDNISDYTNDEKADLTKVPLYGH